MHAVDGEIVGEVRRRLRQLLVITRCQDGEGDGVDGTADGVGAREIADLRVAVDLPVYVELAGRLLVLVGEQRRVGRGKGIVIDRSRHLIGRRVADTVDLPRQQAIRIPVDVGPAKRNLQQVQLCAAADVVHRALDRRRKGRGKRQTCRSVAKSSIGWERPQQNVGEYLWRDQYGSGSDLLGLARIEVDVLLSLQVRVQHRDAGGRSQQQVEWCQQVGLVGALRGTQRRHHGRALGERRTRATHRGQQRHNRYGAEQPGTGGRQGNTPLGIAVSAVARADRRMLLRRNSSLSGSQPEMPPKR